MVFSDTELLEKNYPKLVGDYSFAKNSLHMHFNAFSTRSWEKEWRPFFFMGKSQDILLYFTFIEGGTIVSPWINVQYNFFSYYICSCYHYVQ